MKELIQALINQGIITAADIQRMTTLELLLTIIERVNELHGLTKEGLEAVQRLLDEGVQEEVIAKLEEWTQDGTFDRLINQTVLKVNAELGYINTSETIYPDEFDGSDTEKLQQAYTKAIELSNNDKKIIIKLNRTFDIDSTITLSNNSYWEFIDIVDGRLNVKNGITLFSAPNGGSSHHAPRFKNIDFYGETGNETIFNPQQWIRFNFDLCRFNNISCICGDNYIQTLRLLNCEIGKVGLNSFIKANGSFDCLIDECRFEQTTTTENAIEIINTGDQLSAFVFRIQNSLFEGYTNSTAIRMSPGYGIKIDGCYFEANRGDIRFEKTGTLVACQGSVTNCCFGASTNSSGYNIFFQSGLVARVTIKDCLTTADKSHIIALTNVRTENNMFDDPGNWSPIAPVYPGVSERDIPTLDSVKYSIDKNDGCKVKITLEAIHHDVGAMITKRLYNYQISICGTFGNNQYYKGVFNAMLDIVGVYNGETIVGRLKLAPLLVSNLEGATTGGTDSIPSGDATFDYYFTTTNTKEIELSAVNPEVTLHFKKWTDIYDVQVKPIKNIIIANRTY